MYLVALSGQVQGQALRLDRNGVLGREPSVEYPLDDPTVSRRHARVDLEAGGVLLSDLGSANGVEINGQRMQAPKLLQEGDVISLGRVTLVYNTRLAGTVKHAGGDLAATSPEPRAARPSLDRHTLVEGELLTSLLAELRNTQLAADEYARLALQSLVDGGLGLTQAALIDWKAGRVLGRVPADGDLSRGKVFRALTALRNEPAGAYIWSGEQRAGFAQQVGIAEVPPFACLAVEAQVGLYLEAHAKAGPLSEAIKAQLHDVAMLMRLPVHNLRLAQQAGSRKLRDADLRLAQRIQRRFLAEPPADVGKSLEIAYSYTPAMMIGGDFCHFGRTKDGEIGVVIGDVSGKGVSGALYMAYLAPLMRQLLPTISGPGEFLRQLQAELSPVLEPGMFVTACAAFVHPTTGICRLGLAGHNPPVLRSAARKVIEMGFDPGSPLGTGAASDIREQRMAMAPGDCLVLTTDGVEEGENSAGEAFGKQRRDAVLVSCDNAEEINRALRTELLAFCGRDRSSDDLTIVCVGRPRS